MVNLNNIYNYYSSELAFPNQNTKTPAKEKDELKTVYKNIIKQNQNSPFYKFAFPDSTQAFAIGIKEAAMQLESESIFLGNHEDSVFEQMTAVSSNENVVHASMNSSTVEDLPDQISVEIHNLAKGQTNVGTYLPSGELSIEPGDYSFGIAIGSNEYTLNLTIHNTDTNIEIQRNLAAALNNNNIGVQASIRTNRIDGTSAMVLRSDTIGLPNASDVHFHFDQSYLENDITSFLGIDQIETMPQNANFSINGDEHSSISNRISLNHSVDLDLLSESDQPVTISLIPDQEKVSDKLSDFIKSYNQLVDLSRNGSSQKGATRLFRDITSVAKLHKDELENAGISIDDNGYMNTSEEIDNAKVQVLFDEKNSAFRRDLKRVTGRMTLNPLEYIDKTVVTYPNTTGNYPNPYQPSKYSGLLYNDYA